MTPRRRPPAPRQCAGAAAALLAALLGAGQAAACSLALVLALDVSSSVDAVEDRLQRQGVAAALTSPAVQGALLAVPGDPVHLSVFEWSGPNAQALILPWTEIADAATLQAAAVRIAASTRQFNEQPTAMGRALSFGATLLAAGPDCRRKVIDVSGDGVNNESYRPKSAYAHFPFDGVVVNGLVISGGDPKIIGFYRQEVLFGPGAFLEETHDFAGYRDAMEEKLLREIAGPALSRAPGPARVAWNAGGPGR